LIARQVLECLTAERPNGEQIFAQKSFEKATIVTIGSVSMTNGELRPNTRFSRVDDGNANFLAEKWLKRSGQRVANSALTTSSSSSGSGHPAKALNLEIFNAISEQTAARSRAKLCA
jgi:hypothetical protein